MTFMDVADVARAGIAEQTSDIYLLWDDSIGTGWAFADLRLLMKAPRGAKVMVLNGRRRCYRLSVRSLVSAWTRRAIEFAYVGELAFTLAFVLVSPFIVGMDLVRGRR